jgi:hypothetical protein
MTMRHRSVATGAPTGHAARHSVRLLLAVLLGLGAALLVSCGSTSKGLIPVAASGPLQSDFEAVRQAAESGNGDCTHTEAALQKTAEDFARLPASVDNGLHNTLRQGIENLRTRALALCTEPLARTTTATTPKTTSSAAPTPTVTQTPSTPSTQTSTSPPPTAPNQGGGTAAPGGEGAGGSEQGPNDELGESRSGGSPGEAGGGGAVSPGTGEPEAGK